jgi:uncharacterized protein YxjI
MTRREVKSRVTRHTYLMRVAHLLSHNKHNEAKRIQHNLQRKRNTTKEQVCNPQSAITTATSIMSKRPTTAPTTHIFKFLSPAMSFGTPHEERVAALKVPRKTMLQVFDKQGYITTERTTLIVKERPFVFSGDSFSIKDTSGNVWFQCRHKGQAFPLRDKKFITDKQGQPIFVMKEDTAGWLRNQYIFHPNQNVEEGRQPEIATIIPNELTFLKAKLYASVHNIASRSRKLLVLKGDPYRRSASIYIGEPKQGGKPVAHIVRNITQTYQLIVEPGVDAAMMVALCIAFDKRENYLRSKTRINNKKVTLT